MRPLTLDHPEFDAGAATRALAAADPALGAVMARVGRFRLALDGIQSPFAALAEAIVYQQLTGRAAATIHGRVKALFRPKRSFGPADILAAPDDTLRSAGLSGAKVRALRDLARRSLDGTVPTLARLRGMEDAEVVERLVEIRGIGAWTAEMLLIFRLGRPDVLPATDYGVRKGFARAFRRALPTPGQVLRRGERWRPYRTVAAWYLWRAADAG